MAGKFKLWNIFRLFLPGICLGLLATGCQTYQQKNKVIVYWREGRIKDAAAEATKQADKNANNKDAIIWRLEEATTLRALGKYEESNRAFEQAQAKMDDYSIKARVRLGQETGALLSNQANLDYEGRSYDGIMLNTYRALNYLALGQTEKARPELIRAYRRQQEAVDENKRRIEKTKEEAARNQNKALFDQAAGDPSFQAQLQNSSAKMRDVKPYADYVNPFTVYLDGIYFMANAADASDLERAHKSLERVTGFAGDNEYVKQDLAELNNRFRGQPMTPTTYVIFETGCAPERGQVRIDIPILFANVSYVGAAFPTLEPQGDFQPVLTVTANGLNYPTKTVASMDGVIVRDFDNEMPVVITKTIAATVTKAVAAYAANSAANRQGDALGLAIQLATAAYQMAVNIADTRTWTTLPKEFQICRFPTPADGKVRLTTPNGIQADLVIGAEAGAKNDLTSAAGVQASLNPRGLVNVIYVRSITAGSPLLVSQFKIK